MTQFAWLETTFCARLALTLGHFLWQGLVLAILAMCVGRLLRRVSAVARYRVFVVALLLMAACPPVTFCLIESTRPVSAVDLPDTAFSAADGERSPYSARVDTRQEVTEPNSPMVTPVTGTSSGPETEHDAPAFVFEPDIANDGESVVATASAASSGDPSEKARVFDWRSYASLAILVYLAGVLAMLVRLAMGVYGGGRLRRRSSPISDPTLVAVIARRARALGLRFKPAVAYCQQIAVPTVIGVLRPTILLPLSVIGGLNPEQLEVILAHELAHIRRYDYLVNLIQRLIEAMLFFHPAVWLVTRRIRIEREHCCDDLVLATGAEPLSYASSLLKAAELGQASRGDVPVEPVVAVGATGRPSDLVDRVRRLVDKRSDGKQSYGGSGPAIRFKLAEVLPKDASLDKLELRGFRLYASRYGSGFDAEQTVLKVAVLGRDNKTLWQGTFPYALFGYKEKWVDLALPEPLALSGSDLKDGSFTVAIDPEANRRVWHAT